jgi:hypothetical protein
MERGPELLKVGLKKFGKRLDIGVVIRDYVT